MGNRCCVHQDDNKVIKIVKINGEVLSYSPPLKVYQVQSQFPGHAISDEFPAVRYVDSTVDMVPGEVYYLLPSPKIYVDNSASSGPGVVRVKLVMSKKQLREWVSKKGVSLDSMMHHVNTKLESHGEDGTDQRSSTCMDWKPTLGSIPEESSNTS